MKSEITIKHQIVLYVSGQSNFVGIAIDWVFCLSTQKFSFFLFVKSLRYNIKLNNKMHSKQKKKKRRKAKKVSKKKKTKHRYTVIKCERKVVHSISSFRIDILLLKRKLVVCLYCEHTTICATNIEQSLCVHQIMLQPFVWFG